MSGPPRFGDYHPKPRRNRHLTDADLARDRFRHTWPVVFIFGGLAVVVASGFVVLSVGWSVGAAVALFSTPLFAAAKVLRWFSLDSDDD